MVSSCFRRQRFNQSDKNGRYNDVNLIGASIIAAIYNSVKETELPFSFGGDGAVIAFPIKYRWQAERTSKGCRKHNGENFNLNLAAGVIPVSKLYEAGYNVLLTKFQTSEHVSQAAFMGDGVLIAQEWVKKGLKLIRIFLTPLKSIYPGWNVVGILFRLMN